MDYLIFRHAIGRKKPRKHVFSPYRASRPKSHAVRWARCLISKTRYIFKDVLVVPRLRGYDERSRLMTREFLAIVLLGCNGEFIAYKHLTIAMRYAVFVKCPRNLALSLQLFYYCSI